MSSECAYSFADLYVASEGKKMSEKFREKFFKMSQEKRNKLVKKWSEKAGWWTEERVGSDGKIYTAFSQEKI